MILKNIKVVNYKSIKEIELPLEEIAGSKACILIGKNESGKTNILKAISNISTSESNPYSEICNKDSKKKKEDVDFIYTFQFDNDENFWKKVVDEKVLPKEIVLGLKIDSVEKGLWADKDSDSIDKDYWEAVLHVDSSIKKSFFVDTENNFLFSTEYSLDQLNIDFSPSVYKIATEEQIKDYIRSKLEDTLETMLPEVIYWQSSDKRYLINEPINLESFLTDTSISPPLKSCFKIAGIDDIAHRISLINGDSEEKQELEDELSEKVTTFINDVWKEHEINFRFRIEGMECKVSVEDKDNTRAKFQMDQRSDGFKQFISILLSISANQLKNNLIILDEPEVHLHPSGVKYLREELLKIAKENYVVIATHSTYMVDKFNLNRHFQVKKVESITSLKQIDAKNPYQEEVIYEALGTSIYEHIHQNVLLLEGKTDKDLFDAFMLKFKSLTKRINSSVTTISLDGVTNLPKYAKFIDGKLVKGIVVVDSDQQGQNCKNNLIRENTNYTKDNTFEITDLIDLYDEATLEDLLPTSVIIDCVKELYDLIIVFEEGKPIFSQIQKALKDANKIRSMKEELTDLKIKISKDTISLLTKKGNTMKKIEEEVIPLYSKFFFNIHKKIVK